MDSRRPGGGGAAVRDRAAEPVLRVKEGRAQWMEDRFTPAAGALPPAAAGKRMRLAPRARIAAADPRLDAALAAPPARVTFETSPVLFEYYPGQGLQVQPLANFGKANPHWTYCASKGDRTCTSLRTLLDAMVSLASARRPGSPR
jgi:hypothetical protein